MHLENGRSGTGGREHNALRKKRMENLNSFIIFHGLGKHSGVGEEREEKRPPQTSREANIRFKMVNKSEGMKVNKEGKKRENGGAKLAGSQPNE